MSPAADNVIKLADRLASELGEEIAQVDLTSLPDDESAERHASLFRRAVRHFSEKAAEAKAAARAEKKALAAERKAEIWRHRDAMAEIEEREAEAEARFTERHAAARRLESSYAEALATAEGRL